MKDAVLISDSNSVSLFIQGVTSQVASALVPSSHSYICFQKRPVRDVHRFMGNFVVKNLDDEEDDGFQRSLILLREDGECNRF